VGLAEPDVAPGGSLAVAVSLLGDSKLVFLPWNNAPPPCHRRSSPRRA
jgi:hypothetical protein